MTFGNMDTLGRELLVVSSLQAAKSDSKFIILEFEFSLESTIIKSMSMF